MIQAGAKIYFMGIGGTGMASVAGLCKKAGYNVSGSDLALYPPTSLMLERLKLEVETPYKAENIKKHSPDLVIVANCLSRGNEEIEYVLENKIPHTSFPALLGDYFLSDKVSTVVAGTHGKTTTTSILAHMLNELGEDPSFMIGGQPNNFEYGFRLGKGKFFAIEGDEYDTAFFDKGPKFLHYRAKHLIMNNLEFDHADIYDNLEAIEKQFKKLATSMESPDRIIANMDDPGVAKIIDELGLSDKVTRVATAGQCKNAETTVLNVEISHSGSQQNWITTVQSSHFGKFKFRSPLSGYHNIANIAQTIACFGSFAKQGDLSRDIKTEELIAAIESFEGVKRRLDLLGTFGTTEIFEDFAHHPTAVKLVIEGFKAAYPERRLLVAFEPRSATQRRNVFQNAYSKSLSLADRIYIGACPVDERIDPEGRMNTDELVDSIGPKALAFKANTDLMNKLIDDITPGDAVIFMSSGSFSGVQHELLEKMQKA